MSWKGASYTSYNSGKKTYQESRISEMKKNINLQNLGFDLPELSYISESINPFLCLLCLWQLTKLFFTLKFVLQNWKNWKYNWNMFDLEP